MNNVNSLVDLAKYLYSYVISIPDLVYDLQILKCFIFSLRYFFYNNISISRRKYCY